MQRGLKKKPILGAGNQDGDEEGGLGGEGFLFVLLRSIGRLVLGLDRSSVWSVVSGSIRLFGFGYGYEFESKANSGAQACCWIRVGVTTSQQS